MLQPHFRRPAARPRTCAAWLALVAVVCTGLAGLAGLAGCAQGDAAAKASPAGAEPGKPVAVTDRTPAPVAPAPAAAATAGTSPAAAAPAPLPALPFITIDTATRTVTVEAAIAVDVHDPETPRVWLEVLACSPDSKEHESLVVTRARPSHIHAALLLIGMQAGEPGRVEWVGGKVEPIAPRGPGVDVSFVVTKADGTKQTVSPAEWITLSSTGKPPAKLEFLFAGSGFTRTPSAAAVAAGASAYAADNAGTIVGLTTFGTETIAMVEVWSPDSGLQAPEFLASSALPKQGTSVKMVLRAK